MTSSELDASLRYAFKGGRPTVSSSIFPYPVRVSEAPLSLYSHLICQVVRHAMQNADKRNPEEALREVGYGVATRFLDVIYVRERGLRTMSRPEHAISFVATNAWRYFFGAPASANIADDGKLFVIRDTKFLAGRFVSVPTSEQWAGFNVGYIAAGYVEGLLHALGLEKAAADCHFTSGDSAIDPDDISIVVDPLGQVSHDQG